MSGTWICAKLQGEGARLGMAAWRFPKARARAWGFKLWTFFNGSSNLAWCWFSLWEKGVKRSE